MLPVHDIIEKPGACCPMAWDIVTDTVSQAVVDGLVLYLVPEDYELIFLYAINA